MAQQTHSKEMPPAQQYPSLSGISNWHLYHEFFYRFGSLMDITRRQEAEITDLRMVLNNERMRVEQHQQSMISYHPENLNRQLAEAHSALVIEQEAHQQLKDQFRKLQSQLNHEMISLGDTRRNLQETGTMLPRKTAEWQLEHVRAEALQAKFDNLAKESTSEEPVRNAKSQPSTAQKRRAVKRRGVTRPVSIASTKIQEPTNAPSSEEKGLKDIINFNEGEESSDCIEVSIVEAADFDMSIHR